MAQAPIQGMQPPASDFPEIKISVMAREILLVNI